jgi:hypothetical protein
MSAAEKCKRSGGDGKWPAAGDAKRPTPAAAFLLYAALQFHEKLRCSEKR